MIIWLKRKVQREKKLAVTREKNLVEKGKQFQSNLIGEKVKNNSNSIGAIDRLSTVTINETHVNS
ncbi:MAG: hypothetical protein HeimC2_14280 [Candidatus Heimdallarchaeota archaeon LC_2]|nr:MAG: hypothetical protein HeimC2_14280 [Candidatus Heimdallarchaeota archaeon LC_2]